MSRPYREPMRHIHDRLVDEVNEMSITIKVHYSTRTQRSEALEKVRELRMRPSWDEVADLLDRVVTEMNQCTEPYIKR